MSYDAPPPPPNDGSGNYGAPPPPGGYGGGPGQPPPNNLVWAILSTLCCCLPLGVVSIVFAAQVNSKWQAGDFAGAQEASDKAKKFAIISAVVGVIGTIIYIAIAAATGGLSGSFSTT